MHDSIRTKGKARTRATRYAIRNGHDSAPHKNLCDSPADLICRPGDRAPRQERDTSAADPFCPLAAWPILGHTHVNRASIITFQDYYRGFPPFVNRFFAFYKNILEKFGKFCAVSPAGA